MKRLKLFLILFAITYFSYSSAQRDSLFKKKVLTNTIVFSSAISSQISLYNLWYKNYQSSSFHFFDDSKQWGYMDKMGHAFSAYQIANNLNRSYNWAGYNQNISLISSSIIAFVYLLNIEIMDGYSSGWGFSATDLAFNTSGIGLFYFQNRLLKKQVLIPKFSYAPSTYAFYRPEVLGSNNISRILKDYNGQTYWLSLKANTLNEFCPNWLMFSLGYSVNERLTGSSTYFESENKTFESYGQYIFSIDIDLSEFKTKNRFLNSILKSLNMVKIPFPAVGIEQKKLRLYPIYF